MQILAVLALCLATLPGPARLPGVQVADFDLLKQAQEKSAADAKAKAEQDRAADAAAEAAKKAEADKAAAPAVIPPPPAPVAAAPVDPAAHLAAERQSASERAATEALNRGTLLGSSIGQHGVFLDPAGAPIGAGFINHLPHGVLLKVELAGLAPGGYAMELQPGSTCGPRHGAPLATLYGGTGKVVADIFRPIIPATGGGASVIAIFGQTGTTGGLVACALLRS